MRHGCSLAYLLYLAIALVNFLLIGKVLYSLSLGLSSSDVLAVSLFIAAALAIPEALLIVYGRAMARWLRRRFTK